MKNFDLKFWEYKKSRIDKQNVIKLQTTFVPKKYFEKLILIRFN